MTVRKHFLQSLPIVAAEFGKKFGVKVEVGGCQACTDGNTISLPEPGPEFPEVELLGFLNHEAGHVRFSKFALLKSINDMFLHTTLNAIEDVRIEREMSKIYPGARSLMVATAKPLVEEHVIRMQRLGKRTHPGIAITTYLVAAGQVEVSGSNVYRPLKDECEKLLKKFFTGKVVDGLKGIVGKMSGMKTTDDALVLAQEVLKLLLDEMKNAGTGSGTSTEGDADEKEAPAQSGQGAPSAVSNGKTSPKSGKKESQRSEDAGQANSDAGSTQSRQTEEESKPENGNDSGQTSADGNCAAVAFKAISMGAKDAGKAFDTSRQVGMKIEKSASERIGTDGESFNTPIEFYSPNDDGPSLVPANCRPGRLNVLRNKGQARIRKGDALTGRLQRALLGFLQAESQRKTWTSDRGMRISSANLTRAVCGSSRIFERRREGRAVDTAVHVLLDLSGSMKPRLEDSIAASVGLLNALRRTPHVSAAFSVLLDSEFTPVVRHGMPINDQAIMAIGALSAWGGTPMAEAVAKASFALANAKASRHVLMVITDGAPSNARAVKAIIRRLEESGVDVVGIGLALEQSYRECMRGFFSNYVDADSVDELPEKLFVQAKRFLAGGFKAA